MASQIPGPNRALAAKLRAEHPTWTLQQIADEIGVCRERVRQMLNKEGAPTRKIPKYKLPKSLHPSRILRIQVLLLHKYGGYNTVQIAKMTNTPQTNVSRILLSVGIRKRRMNIAPPVLTCAYCGNQFRRSVTGDVLRHYAERSGKIKNPDLHFCSVECVGHWLSEETNGKS